MAAGSSRRTMLVASLDWVWRRFRSARPRFANPGLITDIADAVGSQSVVVVLDARRSCSVALGSHDPQRHDGNGTLPDRIRGEAERLGAGEIVINSVDNDGVMKGYDMALAERVRAATTLP